MTRLQIMAYNPWNTNEDDVTWGVGYTEEKLYDIIQKVRKDYPRHNITLYFENGRIKTYEPLHREMQYI